MTKDVYIFDSIRTPRGRGRPGGGLYEVKPIDLVGGLLSALEERNGLDTALVGDLILGNVNPLGEQGSVLPKSAALMRKWAQGVCGVQINRFCASGLEALNMAAAKISAGHEDLLVAGGFESMSRVPMGSDGGPWAEDIETSVATYYVPQGISADLIAARGGFTRSDADAFALQSQKKAAMAASEGRFDSSIVPVKDQNGLTILAKDELIRANADIEGLAKLKPSFGGLGDEGFRDIVQGKFPDIGALPYVHTAGNSSGIADGAALVLLGSAEAGTAAGLTPRARVAGGAVIGGDPTIMLAEPAAVTRKLLDRLGVSINDIDLFEINEAFASVVLHTIAELGVDPSIVNPNGGSIAMGHPLGATGAVLTGTLLDELERRDQKRGIVTLCAASGMGIATLIERV